MRPSYLCNAITVLLVMIMAVHLSGTNQAMIWTNDDLMLIGLQRTNITRVASWGPDGRKCLFSEVRGGIWTPHSPVLIKISADRRPLNQLTVKKLFFSLIIKTFCQYHHHIVHEKAINLSVWMKEICTLLVELHIISSRMQRVNQHANVGTADLDYSSGTWHRNASVKFKSR